MLYKLLEKRAILERGHKWKVYEQTKTGILEVESASLHRQILELSGLSFRQCRPHARNHARQRFLVAHRKNRNCSTNMVGTCGFWCWNSWKIDSATSLSKRVNFAEFDCQINRRSIRVRMKDTKRAT